MAKAPTISAGPASGNDFFSVTEDQVAGGGLVFNVLANDPKKAALYSLDNATVADLLQEDMPGIAELSALGNFVRITSDGKVAYDAGLNGSLIQGLAAGETLTDSFLYATRQGANLVWQTVNVTITGTNDAPVAAADTGLGLEDMITTGTVAFNDSDVDHNAVLHFAAAGNLPAGFAMASDGSWSLDGSDPAYQALGSGENLNVAVAYTVTDEHGASSSSILVLTVTGTNDAPQVSGAVTGTAAEDGAPVVLDALASASDVDHDAALSVVGVPQELPAGVTYDAANHSFTLDSTNAAFQQLADGETTVVTVSYGVSDGTATAPASVSWTVVGTNDAPVAIGQAINATIELYPTVTVLSGQVTATDADAGAQLTYAMHGFVPDGFVMNPDGSWHWTLELREGVELSQGEISAGQLSFVATDEHGATSTGILQISLTGSNDAPIREDAFAAATEDQVISGTYHGFDPDHGAVLSYSLDPQSDPGFTIAGNGSWQFDAGNPAYQSLAAGQTRQVVAGILVTDEHGASVLSPLFVTVTGTNDAPTAVVSVVPAQEDAATSGQLVASDPDHGATLTYSLNGLAPQGFTLNSNGSWTFNGGGSQYQGIGEGETYNMAVGYTVTDEHGAATQATLTVAVEGTNDTPVAGAFSDTVHEDTTVYGQFRADDADFDDQLTYTILSPLPPGLTVAADGAMTWDLTGPATQYLGQGETATQTLDWRATDQHGAFSDGTWTVTLVGSNDRPVLQTAPAALPHGQHDQPYTVSTSDLLTGWVDPDGDLLSVANVTADHGTVTHNGSGFFSTYTVTLEAGYSGPVTLSYQVADQLSQTAASQTFTLDAGTSIGGTTSGAVVEARYGSAGTPTASGALTIIGDDPHLVAVGSPTASAGGYGKFTVTADGLWQYNLDNSNFSVNSLNSGQTLSDSFTVHATDGTAQQIDVLIRGATDWATISTYSNTNDPNNLDSNRGAAGTDNLSTTVVGTAGAEIVTGGSLNQNFDMQAGGDTVYAQAGDDIVVGGAGSDFLAGQAGNDFLSGGLDNDFVYGGSGNDFILGDEGFDTLYGGSGIDSIDGGAGRDVIIGGYNFDQLTGGADGDTFTYTNVFDSGDFIVDFQVGLDGIDLRGIDPNSQQAGDQAFAFSADGAAAYSIWLVQNGSNLEVYGDTDGFAGTADFMITLQNVTMSTAFPPPGILL